MCGINGILRLRPDAPAIDRGELLRCREQMRSRGPDGCGEWLSPDGRMALAHRRLAVLDPSPAGAQPMATPDGRYRIVFNGEIYNFRELRRELEAEGHRFRSQGDTEVLLALYAREGEPMLRRLRGMYALALWDAREERLLLARDPLGIKPLYYTTDGGTLRFASQVKALEASAPVSLEPDPAAVAGFLLWGSVPEPLTIRKSIRALPAGHRLIADRSGLAEPRAHYAFGEGGGDGRGSLESALEESVAAHLVSDVPLGVFLSAGLDSALVAAFARRHLDEPPTTVTLRFEAFSGTPLDEGPLAARVAEALGTRHVEQRISREELEGLQEAALAAMDQPSIDGFNTFLVSRAAREAGLKVMLSGLGGDEILGSYPSFAQVPRAARLARRTRLLPGAQALWPAAARLLGSRRPKLVGLLRYGASLEGAYFLRRGLFLPQELPRLLGAERAAEGLAAYDPLADGRSTLAELPPAGGGPNGKPDSWLAVHLLESGQYLRNQLLRDSDWASMAHSLELRVPLVDAHLRESLLAGAPRLPKAAVVRAAAPELPRDLFRRPKTGFAVPAVEQVEGAASHPRNRCPGNTSRRLALRVLEAWGALTP